MFANVKLVTGALAPTLPMHQPRLKVRPWLALLVVNLVCVVSLKPWMLILVNKRGVFIQFLDLVKRAMKLGKKKVSGQMPGNMAAAACGCLVTMT